MTGENNFRIEKPNTLTSRNITILGQRTSVRLEPEMWQALHDIAEREQCRIHDICSLIKLRKNRMTSLTAAIRVFLMLYYRASSTEEGHGRAGHGSFENMLQRAGIPKDVFLSGQETPMGEAVKRPVSIRQTQSTYEKDAVRRVHMAMNIS